MYVAKYHLQPTNLLQFTLCKISSTCTYSVVMAWLLISEVVQWPVLFCLVLLLLSDINLLMDQTARVRVGLPAVPLDLPW